MITNLLLSLLLVLINIVIIAIIIIEVLKRVLTRKRKEKDLETKYNAKEKFKDMATEEIDKHAYRLEIWIAMLRKFRELSNDQEQLLTSLNYYRHSRGPINFHTLRGMTPTSIYEIIKYWRKNK